MNNSKPGSFMDSRTLLAILLIGVLWIGWQMYLQNKYPEAYQKTGEQEEKVGEQNQQVAKQKALSEKAVVAADEEVSQTNEGEVGADPGQKTSSLSDEEFKKVMDSQPQSERLTKFNDDVWEFDISSKGMGIKNLQLHNYTDRDGKEISLGKEGGYLPMETTLRGYRKPLYFDVKKVEDTKFVGKAKVNNLEIVKTVEVQSLRYSFVTHVKVKGADQNFTGLKTFFSERIKETSSSGFMFAQFDTQDVYAVHSGTSDRYVVTPEERLDEVLSKVSMASISSHYFAQAIVDDSSILPELKATTDPSTGTVLGVLRYSVIDRTDEYEISYTGFMGPKSHSLLNKIDPQLGGVIDFGMFGWIGRYILKLMRWFHSIVGNWGVAIVLLTILVRILVLPFNIMSYNSMKSMQKIQPRIKELREKYKDDKEKLNQEMMTLMKTHKVNPLGGCLPVLLQFPVFIALYQVLGQSIELYKAPFIFWIDDLSLKDPYYVLPILMGITMFLQQKVTPNTMDPAQQKVFMIMPIIFAFFMVGLPSGLTLYIFISALFSVLQTYYFMRDRQVEGLTEAKAV